MAHRRLLRTLQSGGDPRVRVGRGLWALAATILIWLAPVTASAWTHVDVHPELGSAAIQRFSMGDDATFNRYLIEELGLPAHWEVQPTGPHAPPTAGRFARVRHR